MSQNLVHLLYTSVIHPWFDWFSGHCVVASAELKIIVIHILAYLPCLDTVVRQNGKSDHVFRNDVDNLIFMPVDADSVVELCSCLCSL
jgi:hypothetical protein